MKIKDIILFSLAILVAGALIWFKTSIPKIAYVDSYKILEEFAGLKEAQGIYKSKVKLWHFKIDSVSNLIDNDLLLVGSNSSSEISHDKLEIIKRRLQYNQYLKKTYQDEMDAFISEGALNLSDGLIDQIDKYIQGFGEEKGYGIILGDNENGQVLYRDLSIDITDEIIEGLNNKYLDNE